MVKLTVTDSKIKPDPKNYFSNYILGYFHGLTSEQRYDYLLLRMLALNRFAKTVDDTTLQKNITTTIKQYYTADFVNRKQVEFNTIQLFRTAVSLTTHIPAKNIQTSLSQIAYNHLQSASLASRCEMQTEDAWNQYIKTQESAQTEKIDFGFHGNR